MKKLTLRHDRSDDRAIADPHIVSRCRWCWGTPFQQLYNFADTVVGRPWHRRAGGGGQHLLAEFLIFGFVEGACVGFGIPVAESLRAKSRTTCTATSIMAYCSAW